MAAMNTINKGRGGRGVSATADKFASMGIGSQRQPRPPPMKAGVQWAAESGDMFLRPSHQLQAGRSYTRKVVG